MTCSESLTSGLRSSVRSALAKVTLEPVLFLSVIYGGMIAIPVKNLYMSKACQVNLNHSAAICNSIYDHEAVQVETQQYVAEIKAYSQMLQALPGVLFTLVAGPLSDRYGRKPLLLISLTGFVLLQLVFLVNAIWFEELAVEYLLIESLQDFTGGGICLYLAMYAYMADITTPQERTRRLAILESFIPLGLLISLPGGTYLKETYGFVVVFATSTAVSCLALLYTVVFVVDSKHRVDYHDPSAVIEAGTEEPAADADEPAAAADGWCLILGSLRTLVRQRPHGGRTWFLAIIIIFTISYLIELGDTSLWYMFFQLQYKMTDTLYSYLDTYFVLIWFFSQLLFIPWLSTGPLRMRDTVILMMGAVLSIAGALIIMIGREIWQLFLSYTLYILYCNMTSLCRSSISKMVDRSEVGSAFSLLGIIQAVLPLGVAPLYGFLYQATLSFYPPMFLLISVVGYLLVLLLAGITQRALARQDRKKNQREAGSKLSQSAEHPIGERIEEEKLAMLTKNQFKKIAEKI